MEAGKLDRRLTLLERTLTTNAANEEEEVFTDVGTVWASKKDVSDAERTKSQEVAATITTRFQVRHSSLSDEITPTWRVRCEGRTYDVRAKKELGRKVGWEISAEARAE
jgi:SPP1 family predicted phage head-tail adaptor